MKMAGQCPAIFHPTMWTANLLLAEGKTTEALVEARHLAARVEQVRLATGPGGVNRGIDVELERVALAAIGRTGLIGGAVGQLHRDPMIIGMDFFLHVLCSE